jgi:hypothetical protein
MGIAVPGFDLAVCQGQSPPYWLSSSPSLPTQADPKYAAGLRIRNAESRLRYFVGLCSSKRLDEATGNLQPAYRYDAMRVMLEWPAPKASAADGGELHPEQQGERKQVRCGEVLLGRG